MVKKKLKRSKKIETFDILLFSICSLINFKLSNDETDEYV